MGAALLPVARYRAVDENGAVMAGAKLYSYQAGTSTPFALYADSALTTPLANPVVADGYGLFAELFMQASGYKLDLQTSTGVSKWTADNVSDPGWIFANNFGTAMVTGAFNVASGYTVTSGVLFVTANGGTVNLPAATGWTQPISIKNLSTSGTLTVARNGSDTIDNVAASYVIAASVSPSFKTLTLLPVAGNWWIWSTAFI
jgi:hypothetical protein